MNTIDISLPDDLQAYVDQQVAERGFETCAEYVRDLIRKEHDRQKLRALLLEGKNSPPAGVADAEYFNRLRDRVRNHERS